MANKVNRTFTIWKVSAEKVFADRKNEKFIKEYVGDCLVEALNKPSRQEIVEAFALKHIHIQKGTKFDFKKVGYVSRSQDVKTYIENSVVTVRKMFDEESDE